MSRTGLDVFDKTLQTTNIWLDELMQQIGPDRQVAWHVLGVVLRALRDRLPVELAAHLGSQLPILVRGIYYDQWRPSDQPQRLRTLDEFLDRIASELANTRPVNVRDATRAVFAVLKQSGAQSWRQFMGDGTKDDFSPGPATFWSSSFASSGVG